MRPIDLPTQQTLKFVLEHAPVSNVTVLEVGCGHGELAFQLKSLGYQITAVDSSAEAVEQARRLGVDAKVAQWPRFEGEPFDLILFTRSLHHIHPLDEAVARAHRLLKPSGLVIVEDFAYEEVLPATVQWFYGVLTLLETCGKLHLESDSFAKTLLNGQGRFEIWRDRHRGDVSLASSIAVVLKNWFEPLDECSAPYLYRYLCAALEDGDEGYAIALRVFEMEESLANAGAVNLIGRRFVGRRSMEEK